MRKRVAAPKSQPDNRDVLKLTVEQLSKLRVLVQPDRWIDETFTLTAIGAFLLKEHLIAPNPKKDSVKAFIVTGGGRQLLRQNR